MRGFPPIDCCPSVECEYSRNTGPLIPGEPTENTPISKTAPTPSRAARIAGSLLVVSMVAGFAAVSMVVFAIATGAWWWLVVAMLTFLAGVTAAFGALGFLYEDFYGVSGEGAER